VEKKYREMEFRPLENVSSPFCRTKWFDIHVKTAYTTSLLAKPENDENIFSLDSIVVINQ